MMTDRRGERCLAPERRTTRASVEEVPTRFRKIAYPGQYHGVIVELESCQVTFAFPFPNAHHHTQIPTPAIHLDSSHKITAKVGRTSNVIKPAINSWE